MVRFDAVFLVDDDPINNLINRRLLGKTGISNRIEEFLGGAEALEKINELNPDDSLIIFLDINMPKINGWKFLELLVEKINHADIKVVMVTSSLSKSEREKSKEYEAVIDFWEKPMDEAQATALKNKLGSWMET